MKATTNIDMTKAITHSIAGFEGNDNAAAGAGTSRERRPGGGPDQGQARASCGLRPGGTAST